MNRPAILRSTRLRLVKPTEPEKPIELTFTYPPSANRLWRIFSGRMLKSEDYRAWLDHNTSLTANQRFRTVRGPYRLILKATAPDKRRRDLDNLLKPCGDLLQLIGAVADDCNMRELYAAWLDGPGSGVTCTVEPL